MGKASCSDADRVKIRGIQKLSPALELFRQFRRRRKSREHKELSIQERILS